MTIDTAKLRRPKMDFCGGRFTDVDCLLAADEIDRLRADNNRLREAVKAAKDVIDENGEWSHVVYAVWQSAYAAVKEGL